VKTCIIKTGGGLVLKWIIRITFILIGGTLGLLLLPQLYELINLSRNPWLNSPYVSVTIGAILLYVMALLLTDYLIEFLKLLVILTLKKQ
jgi:uncharacterized protein YacL